MTPESNEVYIMVLTWRFFNPFRMGGGGEKAAATSFSPVTSTNVGISLQNFLTFSFNPFATLV